MIVLAGHTCAYSQAKDGDSFVEFIGKLDDNQDDTKGFKVYIYKKEIGILDSSTINNGIFKLKCPFESPDRYLLYTNYDVLVRGGFRPLTILVDTPAKIEITGSIYSFNNCAVKGAEANSVFGHFLIGLSDLLKGIARDSVTINRMRQEDEEFPFQKYLLPFFDSIIAKEANSVGSAYILDLYGSRYFDYDIQKKLYAHLTESNRNNRFSKELEERFAHEKDNEIGQLAHNFTFPDQDGRMVKLNSYRGKYVVLDFWVTNCYSCVQEVDYLKKIYSTYKNKGLEIISVSLDEDINDWKRFINEQKLSWTQLIDNKSGTNISKKLFALKGFPSIFLLDPGGRIIEKNLNGMDLEKRIDGILK